MTDAATITIRVPREFRANGNGTAELTVTAASIGEALAELERQYSALYLGICDETGRLRRHINLFVNSSQVRELETSLESGDVITILPAVSGG